MKSYHFNFYYRYISDGPSPISSQKTGVTHQGSKFQSHISKVSVRHLYVCKGCGNILGINFLFILGINFFLWFQLEVETFQVGVGCPCRGGRLKKNSWRGVGGWQGIIGTMRCCVLDNYKRKQNMVPTVIEQDDFRFFYDIKWYPQVSLIEKTTHHKTSKSLGDMFQ